MAGQSGAEPSRPARIKDLPALLDLLEAVAGEGRWIGRELPLDRAAAEDRIATSIEAADQLLLIAPARAGGRDVALGSLSLSPAGGQLGPPRPRHVPRRRAQPTAHKITLQHWPHNVAAHRLYRRFGFTVEGYLHQHWPRVNGELWDAVLMGLLLDRDQPSTG